MGIKNTLSLSLTSLLAMGLLVAGCNLTRKTSKNQAGGGTGGGTDVDQTTVALLTNLEAYWKLDESSSGSRSDASGNGYDLVERGTSTPITPAAGIINDAAVFTDGNDYNNGYDFGLTNTSFSPFNIAGDLSISLWFNTTAHLYDGQFLAGNDNFGIWFRPGDNHIKVYAATSDQSNVDTPAASVTPGSWTHVVVIKKGTKVSIYINGTQSVSSNITGTMPTNLNTFDIGEDSVVGYPAHGSIDEVGFWSRALTTAEITQLYNSGGAWAYSQF